MKKEIEYNLIPLTEVELKETRLNRDKVEIDLMNAKGKLEIQEFKIKYEIPKLELNEDVEEIEKSIEKIEKSKEELDKEDPRYEEKIICRDYDVLCGEKQLELAKLKVKKGMGARIANEAIDVLKGRVLICEGNLKVFNDQLKNKVRKELKVEEHIQLEEGPGVDRELVNENKKVE